ncbi:hypothetical protein HL653_18545 [Sphingomonas sp. AP4-R1]|uniref:hypothetical protein n=1 Tax=Sphingomonas sp. AP4-R1 TaxID=2735134 RepID=UPI0014935518|nr:hypothetical protein [Sphingomonas sp. AP4-R1]QJU59485.1 hypothetical protein HL653_18545 [Sphingomonas sp. AP4-R1]
MTAILVAGFSLSIAMGHSSFGAPLRVHLHGIVFFGWTMLYLLQNILVGQNMLLGTRYREIHKMLGWLSVVWVPAMVALGTWVTVAMAREGYVPFFFQPLYFLVMDPLSVLSFAGLTTAAIVMRKRTQWHRRLMFCGMTILLGPGVGRMLPMPFLIPYAGWAVFAVIILFPLAGMIRDLRVSGAVHPAWWWGAGSIVAMMVAIDLITFSPLGLALYGWVTAGSPGASVAPLAFPPFPGA